MPSRLTTSSAAAAASALVQPSTVAGASRAVAASAAHLSLGRAGFSTTSSLERNTLTRRKFLEWANKGGSIYRRHRDPGPQYVALGRVPRQQSRYPFPINPLFRTTPVLNDGGRELVWRKVMRDGESIKAVSAELGVDIARVAAVVRLKEVEKDWISKGKKLATPYSKAILSMLPTRFIKAGVENRPLEDVNELYNHPATQKQLFWPTSEARQFTREDAAKAFHAKMLSADKRVPIPELIQMEKDLANGRSPVEAKARFIEAAQNSERIAAEKVMRRAMAEEEASTKVNTPRFEFRFQNYNSETVGRDGKSPNAVGWKYGMPHYDRKKGLAKIPTSAP